MSTSSPAGAPPIRPGQVPLVAAAAGSTTNATGERLAVLGIVVVAFLVRAVPVLRGGGLFGSLGYDDGVYFASAVAFVNGVIPYRDLLLLHPPGMVLLLSPFALLAGATTDATGFAVARLAFMALGAVNAGLLVLVARRFGLRAALFAGALYAIWASAIRVERSTLLLDPETTLLLAGVLVLGLDRALGPRRAALGGALLGVSVAIQLWQVVPLAVVGGAMALGSRDRPGGRRSPVLGYALGAIGAVAAVCLPFLLSAPAAFIRYVVIDQLGRPPVGPALLGRLRDLEGIPPGGARFGLAIAAGVLGLAVVGAAATAFVAWRRPGARMWSVLVMVEMGCLLVAPVFISHYSGWLAPGAAIVLGTAAAALSESLERSRRWVAVWRAIPAVLATAIVVATIQHRLGVPIQRTRLEHDLAGAVCIAADAPVLLIETGALRRDLRAGCRLVVDPTGTSYDSDPGRITNGSVSQRRRGAPGYQAAMVDWYGGADATMLMRQAADALAPSTLAAIAGTLPVSIRRGSVTVLLPRAAVATLR